MMIASELAKRLADRALEVAKFLYPDGKQIQQHWVVGSIQGEPGKSLKICLSGEKKGRWADFATNHHGDLLDLWRLKRNLSAVEAIKEAKQWFGHY